MDLVFVELCFIVDISVLVDLPDAYTRTLILQGHYFGIGTIIWLPQRQCSNPEEFGSNQPVQNHNKT